MGIYGNRRIGGQVNAVDASSATAVISAVTGGVLSLRSVTLSNSGTAAQNIIVQDGATTPLKLMQIYLAVNSTWSSPIFDPGTFAGGSGLAINILASTTNAVSAAIEVYLN